MWECSLLNELLEVLTLIHERALYVISDCMFEMIFPQLITPGYKDSCHVGVLSLTVNGWRLIFMGTDNTGGDVMNAFSVRKLSHHPEMKCSIIEKASLLKYPLVSIFFFVCKRTRLLLVGWLAVPEQEVEIC